MIIDDSCFRILIFCGVFIIIKDNFWRPLLKNSCVSSWTLIQHDYQSDCQEYFIRHDYQSLYPNSYHMNRSSTNLYYMICVYTICMFKFCINTILRNAICINTICIYYTICIYAICIYTICTYTHLWHIVKSIWFIMTIGQTSSSLSGTKTQGGTYEFI